MAFNYIILWVRRLEYEPDLESSKVLVLSEIIKAICV